MKSVPIVLLLKFGKQVKKFKLSKNLSQEDLADLADLHWTYISGIERGVRNISLKNIAKISKALDIKRNISEFLTLFCHCERSEAISLEIATLISFARDDKFVNKSEKLL